MVKIKGKSGKWLDELPMDIWVLIEDLYDTQEELTIQDAIEWGEWVMEQSVGETFYNIEVVNGDVGIDDGDDDGVNDFLNEVDAGVEEVRVWLKKYKRYKK